jgi:hypothetical protein
MFKVLVDFSDLKDKNHKYRKGDVYPRSGLKVTEARIGELSGRNNRRKTPLIAEVEDPKPKPEEKPKKGAKK